MSGATIPDKAWVVLLFRWKYLCSLYFEGGAIKANEYTLLHVAEILSCLSSTPSGRKIIMLGSLEKESTDR